jgi:hypothetical protein
MFSARITTPIDEPVEYEIDPAWHGELPFTVLLGRDGLSTWVLDGAGL